MKQDFFVFQIYQLCHALEPVMAKCYACHQSGGRFYLPKDRQQRQKWLLRLNVEEPSPRTNKRICLRHFRTLDIKKGVKRVHLKDNVRSAYASYSASQHRNPGCSLVRCSP